jgi:hypothetical protein
MKTFDVPTPEELIFSIWSGFRLIEKLSRKHREFS